MQHIDALTLHHLANELDVKLAGGKVNRIQQASHYDMVIHFWVGGKTGRQKLYINIHPEHSFAALLDNTDFLSFPKVPPNLCVLLRKHLLSGRIQRIETIPNERVLALTLENYNELGQRMTMALYIELMGKQSNIILADTHDNTILACAHGVSEQMSRKREIRLGDPYCPPPQPKLPPIQTASQAAITQVLKTAQNTSKSPVDALIANFSGTGKALLYDIAEHTPHPAEQFILLQELIEGSQLCPAIRQDLSAFSLFKGYQQNHLWQIQPSINTMVSTFFVHHLQARRFQHLQGLLLQALDKQDTKLQKRYGEVSNVTKEEAEALKKAGDLLTVAASQRLTADGTTITVLDYDTQTDVTLTIDDTLSLQDNANAYYKRYKKLKTRLDLTQQATYTLNEQSRYLDELRTMITLAQNPDELLLIWQELETQGWIKPPPTDQKKKYKKDGIQPLQAHSSDGFTILIGKGGLQNDALISKLSRPEDIWLHTHEIPGSHILIKTEKKEVPNTTLEEAAMLAAHFSKAQGGVNVPVIYTHAKYLRKIPNSYPGHVRYTHETGMFITPNLDTITQLLTATHHT